jgi:hypothetical protein
LSKTRVTGGTQICPKYFQNDNVLIKSLSFLKYLNSQ